LPAEALQQHQQQEHHTAEHVGHVQPGHHVEERAEDAVAHAEAEQRVVVQLQAEKGDPKQDRQPEPAE
jgi:hypothetical protein